MTSKIKKFISKLRIFKRLRILEDSNERLREDNFNLKGQLINKRKTIDGLRTKIVDMVNDLNLLGEELDKIKEKKHKAEIIISELSKRRNEFLNRLSSVPDASINSLADYKFWLSKPFITDNYISYIPNKDDIDGVAAIRGLGEVFKKIDEKD